MYTSRQGADISLELIDNLVERLRQAADQAAFGDTEDDAWREPESRLDAEDEDGHDDMASLFITAPQVFRMFPTDE